MNTEEHGRADWPISDVLVTPKTGGARFASWSPHRADDTWSVDSMSRRPRRRRPPLLAKLYPGMGRNPHGDEGGIMHRFMGSLQPLERTLWCHEPRSPEVGTPGSGVRSGRALLNASGGRARPRVATCSCGFTGGQGRRRLGWLLAGFLVLLLAGSSDASAGNESAWAPSRAGVRSGFSASSFEDLYYEVGAYADWDLPWDCDLGRSWHLGTGVDVATGWLSARGNHAFIASAGPLVSLARDRLPLEFEVGFSPTLLSRQQFDQDDLGSWCQFTSHAAVLWQPGRHFLLGYRLQHMSNGGISEDNPGLNLHCLVLGWRF